jgi:hypothetical protein
MKAAAAWFRQQGQARLAGGELIWRSENGRLKRPKRLWELFDPEAFGNPPSWMYANKRFVPGYIQLGRCIRFRKGPIRVVHEQLGC